MTYEGKIQPTGTLATRIHRYPWWLRVRDFLARHGRAFMRRVR